MMKVTWHIVLHIFSWQLFVSMFVSVANTQTVGYSWLFDQTSETLRTIETIPAPMGFERVTVASGSFGDWLRHLPLYPADYPVHLFDGRLKPSQRTHAAVIRIDVGDRDLQQCADAVIRLRAEYLFACKNYRCISFRFTSGHKADYLKWRNGFRPRVSRNNVSWIKHGEDDSSYKSFRQYLDTVFMYAGSYSLSKELSSVSIDNIRIGDVFIQGGFPGHAVIVVDMAENKSNGKKACLLAQSYMPAQEIHILKNPRIHNNTPWYFVGTHDKLFTPEWTFQWNDLKRFDK